MAINRIVRLEAFKQIRDDLRNQRATLAAHRGGLLVIYPELSSQIDNQYQGIDDAFADRLLAIKDKIDTLAAMITDADRVEYAKATEAVAKAP